MKRTILIILVLISTVLSAGEIVKTGTVNNSDRTWKLEKFETDSVFYVYIELYSTGEIFRKGKIQIDGTKYGEWSTYFQSGSIWIKMWYFNDNLHGPQFAYREDGSIALIGEYLNGLKHGCFRQIDESSNIVFSRLYKNGEDSGDSC